MAISKKLILAMMASALLLLFIIGSASALGVTPARTTVSFQPGLSQTVKVTVVNSEYKDIQLVAFVKGELNQSVSLSSTSFSMSADEESREFEYTFTLPASLSPGPHTADIVFYQQPGGASASEAFVGATVAVVSQLVVNVPYPGKYAIADLNVLNAQQNAAATFIIPIVALGTEDIDSASARIQIFDQNNQVVGEIETPSISIRSGTRGEIVSQWIANVPLGRYIAKARVEYDGEEIEVQQEFAIGNETLELLAIEVPNFQLGGIAKFEMLIENKWSEPIIGAYAQTQVFEEGGQLMADFKSPTYDIPALTRSTFTSYWDTAGIEKGIYNTSVFMRYGTKYSQQDIQLQVEDNEIIALGLGFVISERAGGSNMVMILSIVIGVLVLMNIAWFLVLRKRIGKKNR